MTDDRHGDGEARDTEREEADIRHMDVGETRTVKETQTYQLWAPDVYFGTDRDVGEIEVTDIEVVEPDLEGDFPDIEVTWQAEVTKQLGRRWDKRPNDGVAKTSSRMRYGGIALTFVIVSAVGVIATKVTNAALEGVTVNGQPMAPILVLELLPAVLLIIGLSTLIVYGLQGGLPGHTGGLR